MQHENPCRPSNKPDSPPTRLRPSTFRKRKAPDNLQRGLFTLFLDDEEGQHVSQVWASKPSAAASMMAPWSASRLRRAEGAEEVPVELVGWDFPSSREELAEASGVPAEELDEGCIGMELVHVWVAEHESDGRKSSLYVIETIGFDQGIGDEPLW